MFAAEDHADWVRLIHVVSAPFGTEGIVTGNAAVLYPHLVIIFWVVSACDGWREERKRSQQSRREQSYETDPCRQGP
jgi:hypothetical protein